MTVTEQERTQEELDEEAFLNKFKRDPTAPRPEWALKPDATGSLETALESVPLFMHNSNPTPDDIQSNPTLMALQTLLYDEQESAEQRATNFKSQGNEAYKEKRLKDALTFYSKGLAEKEVSEGLRAQLYGNRSAVWWTMERWTDCLNDCKMAIAAAAAGGDNEKVTLRGIRCAIKLKDASFLRTHTTTDADLQKRINAILVEADKRERMQNLTASYLQKRFNLEHQKGVEDELFSMLPDLDPSTLPTVTITDGRASFPMLVLYPEHAQCDFIESFREDDTFSDHLDRLFATAADWDTCKTYTDKRRVRLFMVNQEKQLTEVQIQWRLKDVFTRIVTRYDRGLLAVHVLPKNNTALLNEFIGRFK